MDDIGHKVTYIELGLWEPTSKLSCYRCLLYLYLVTNRNPNCKSVELGNHHKHHHFGQQNFQLRVIWERRGILVATYECWPGWIKGLGLLWHGQGIRLHWISAGMKAFSKYVQKVSPSCWGSRSLDDLTVCLEDAHLNVSASKFVLVTHHSVLSLLASVQESNKFWESKQPWFHLIKGWTSV